MNKPIDKKTITRAAKKVGVAKVKKEITLKDQYSIIREDLLRLRDDIAKGYSMTRDWFEKNGTVRGLILKAK